MKRKVLSMLLTLCMVLSLVPATAFAEDIGLQQNGDFAEVELTYGQKLSDVNEKLKAAAADVTMTKLNSDEEVAGTWEWKTPDTVPEVATTTAQVKFTPTAQGGSDNYVPPEGTVTIKVAPKELTVKNLTVPNRPYDGKTEFEVATAGAELKGKVSGDDVKLPEKITGKIDDASASETAKAVSFEENSITLEGDKKDNYTLAGITDVTVTITKADRVGDAITKAVEVPVNSAAAIEVDLANELASIVGAKVKSAAEGTDTDNVVSSATATGNDTKVTITPNSVADAGKTATVTATVESTNFNDFEVTINLSTAGAPAPQPDTKKDLQVTKAPTFGEVTYKKDLTLNEVQFTNQGEVKTTDDQQLVAGKWSWTNAGTKLNAGDNQEFEATFTPDTEAGKYNKLTENFQVTVKKATPAPADITVAEAVTFTVGKQDTVDVTVTDLADTLTDATVAVTAGQNVVKEASLTDKKLTLTPADNLTEGDNNQVTLTITSKNHENITVTLNVTVKAAQPAPAEIPIKVDKPLEAGDITYGEKLSTSQIAGKVVTADESATEVKGTWEWPADQKDTVPTAGDHKVTLTFKPTAQDVQYAELTAEVTVKVNAKELTIDGLKATNRKFDGTNKVELKNGTIAAGGKVGQDEVDLPAQITGTVESPDADTAEKAVTVDEIVLTGKDAANYTVKKPEGITVIISKATLSKNPDPSSITHGFETTGDQTYPLGGLLPDNAGELKHTVVVGGTKPAIITGTPTVDPMANMTYKLAGGQDGDSATLTVSIESKNYETVQFVLTVNLNGLKDQPALTIECTETNVDFGKTLEFTVKQDPIEKPRTLTVMPSPDDGSARVVAKDQDKGVYELIANKAGVVTIIATSVAEGYNNANAVKAITINKVAPDLGVVSGPAKVVAGTKPAEVQLTWTNKAITGTLTLTDSQITVGQKEYNWKFVPNGESAVNYTEATGKVTLNVVEAPQPTGKFQVTFVVENGYFRSVSQSGSPVNRRVIEVDNVDGVGHLTDGQIRDVMSDMVPLYNYSRSYWRGPVPTASQEIKGNNVTFTFVFDYNYYPPVNPNPNVPGNGTVVNPDGSVTTTVTRPDGTRVDTTVDPNGTKTEVERRPNGTVQTTEARRDGTRVATTSDNKGSTTADVFVPHNVGETVVTVPTVTAPTGSTVAVIVDANGQEHIVKESVVSTKGVSLPVEGSAKVKIVNNTKLFADVQSAGHWAKDAVEFVTAREIFNGTGAGRFEPNAGMTRGMLAVALHNLENNPNAIHSGSFSDVNVGDWYSEAVLWAADKGIVSGYEDGNFHAGDKITREQLAVMLYRYANSPRVSYTSMYFNDADKVGSYAEDAVRWAVENGILTGKTGNMLDPQGQATRAEVATMLQRFLSATIK